MMCGLAVYGRNSASKILPVNNISRKISYSKTKLFCWRCLLVFKGFECFESFEGNEGLGDLKFLEFIMVLRVNEGNKG